MSPSITGMVMPSIMINHTRGVSTDLYHNTAKSRMIKGLALIQHQRKLLYTFLLVFVISCAGPMVQEPPTVDSITKATENIQSKVLEAQDATVRRITSQINASKNDAEEIQNSRNLVDFTAPAINLGVRKNISRYTGLRFTGLNLPQNAITIDAYIEVTATLTESTTSGFGVYVENSEAPGDFPPQNMDAAPRLEGGLSWQNVEPWTAGSVYKIPVERLISEFAYGKSAPINAINIYIAGNGSRQFVSFDGSPSKAPKLIIDYRLPTEADSNVLGELVRHVEKGSDDGVSVNGYHRQTLLYIGDAITGIRFPNLAIPQGAEIKSATIGFMAKQDGALSTPVRITGDALDNTPAYDYIPKPGTAEMMPGTRPQTTALLDWQPQPWMRMYSYRTGDLKTILQEIVDRPGWKSGNAAAFTFRGARGELNELSAYSQEDSTSTLEPWLKQEAPRLYVSYTVPTPQEPLPPVTCDGISGSVTQPWVAQDVGTSISPGKSQQIDNVFSTCSYGNGLSAANDSFHFVHQPLNGDGAFTARLASVDAASASASAGIMIREALNPTSNYAALKVTGNQVSFSSRGQMVSGMANSELFKGIFDSQAVPARESQRSDTGVVSDALTSITAKPSPGFENALQNILQDGQLSPQASQLSQPVWLRLTRQGTALRSYKSNDGQTWTPVATATIPMAQQLYVGLWSTSQGNSSPATAKFDNSALGPIIVDPSDPPVAAFTAKPSLGAEPLAVTFDGSTSQRAQSYAWDFNAADGITVEASGVTATTTYATPGTYTVTLTVQGAAGQQAQATQQITVEQSGTSDEDFANDLESLPQSVLTRISAEAIEYGRTNQNLTLEQLNTYASLKVHEAAQQEGLKIAQEQENGMCFPIFGCLSYSEWEVTKKHKYLALISLTPRQAAISYESLRFPNEHDSPQGREDAFRHVFWNVALVDVFNYTLGVRMPYPEAAEAAQWFADAHDNILFGVPTQEYMDATPAQVLDREMDLHNNAWARAWALQNLPAGLRQPGTFESFYTVLADVLEPTFKDHNEIDPNGPIVVREFPTNEVPQYAIRCTATNATAATVYWCLMPVGYDLRNVSIEIWISDLYDLPKAATVISRIQGDDNSTKIHTRGAQWQPHTLELGTYHAIIEVLDEEGFLILGLKKQFVLTADVPDEEPDSAETLESYAFWKPTARFTADIKKTYDGPNEDCPRLQGIFTMYLRGVFDGGDPQIPFDNSHTYMGVDQTDFYPAIEIRDLGSNGLSPLTVEAKTYRNCNFSEGQHELGFVAQYFEPDTRTGFYAHIGDDIQNVDNRWPVVAWNKTEVNGCTPVYSLRYSAATVGGRLGDPQYLGDILPGENKPWLARWETIYRGRFEGRYGLAQDYYVTSTIQLPWIDQKYEMYGEQHWFHAVGTWEPGGCTPLSPSRLQRQEASQIVTKGYAHVVTHPKLDKKPPRAGELGW